MRKTFLDIQTDYNNADFIILNVPYENKLSWKEGTKNGPKAIIEASKELEFYSLELKDKICDKVKINTQPPLKVSKIKYKNMIKIVEKSVKKAIESDKKFCLIGGEHSITIGAVYGLDNSKIDNFSIIYLDAHADLRDWFLGSKYNHACTLRRIIEKNNSILAIGVRSYSYEEAEFIKKNKIKILGPGVNLKEIKKLIKQLKNKIYISIDMDVFDPSEIPAVGTPQPGGMHWNEILKLIKIIAKNKEIIGFDIVELSPIKNNYQSEFLGAKLLYNLIGYCFKDKFKI